MMANGERLGSRRGQSLLEVQVAFALLGIGLAGLCQFVVVHLRQVRAMENRLQGQVQHYDRAAGTYLPMQQIYYDSSSGTYKTKPMGQTYYLVPWQNIWARKLAGSAQIVSGSSSIPCDPGPDVADWGATQINVIEVDAPAGGQDVMVYVDVLTSS